MVITIPDTWSWPFHPKPFLRRQRNQRSDRARTWFAGVLRRGFEGQHPRLKHPRCRVTSRHASLHHAAATIQESGRRDSTIYIHHYCDMYIFIHYLSSGDIYIYREREGDRSRGRRPDPSFTIPYPLRPPTSEEHHHSRSPPAVCIYSFTIYKQERSSYRNEQPGISIIGRLKEPWHHTISLDLRLLAPGHHHALVRSHIARLGIMGIVAAIIITCDM